MLRHRGFEMESALVVLVECPYQEAEAQGGEFKSREENSSLCRFVAGRVCPGRSWTRYEGLLCFSYHARHLCCLRSFGEKVGWGGVGEWGSAKVVTKH